MADIRELKRRAAAQHQAQQAFRKVDARPAQSEYERAQNAFHANRERLKAERLARELAAAAAKAHRKLEP
ncbi:hypothetical protein AS156_28845 [Bradyrhizobium macuxiense]|uniref:Uncharacterized protein n=1 Tax=Bradyrhizobium macuxiense TaxID=1755647 RepID=A0A109K445_9BRAD|nr:hypothetical protein [Bradyrhizobium macuxiense]KWV60405.1 hypothetical protein AS156_28845 [Bradyrhizobium macuxiense]